MKMIDWWMARVKEIKDFNERTKREAMNTTVELKAAQYELEYVEHELSRLKKDKADLQYKIYELEAIADSQTDV